MLKKIIALILILFVSFNMTGCWGKNELNEIGIVTVIGVDIEANGDIRITVLAVLPIGGATTPLQRSNTWIGTATGLSVSDAFRNLNATASKRLVLYHNRIILIGEGMARAGLQDIIDFFIRSRSVRYSSLVLITEGEAKRALSVPADIQKNLYSEIDGMTKNKAEWSKAYVPNLKDFSTMYANKATGDIGGALRYLETSENTFSTALEDYKKLYWKDAKVGMTYLSGTAVFKHGKLAGWMNSIETRGYMWITNKVSKGVVVVEGESSKGIIAFEPSSAKSDVSLDIVDNRITANVKLMVKGGIVEETTDDILLEEATLKKIQDKLSQAIIGEMKLAVEKAQKEYKSDIFDFAGYIHRGHPKIWKTIKNEWDKKFVDIDVQYDVKIVIQRMGVIYEDISTVGEK